MILNKFFIFGTIIVGILIVELVNSSPTPRFLIKTGRSRIRPANLNSGRGIPIGNPWMRMLGRSDSILTRNLRRSAQNPDGMARFGCESANGRCFFGLFGGGDYDYGNSYAPLPPPPPPQMDYYEVCDEYYDPYNDTFIEDCSSNTPDFYY